MKTEAGELSIGDVVRDPEAHRTFPFPNATGPSAWGRVLTIKSRPDDSEVSFTYEYVDEHGNPTGRVDHASYDYEAPLEWRTHS